MFVDVLKGLRVAVVTSSFICVPFCVFVLPFLIRKVWGSVCFVALFVDLFLRFLKFRSSLRILQV